MGLFGDSGGNSGGLFGMFNDPDKFAALAMVAKGLSPYSDLDPAALIKLAQAQKEHAAAQQFRQQQLDLSRRAQDREDAEFGYKKQDRDEARQGSSAVMRELGQSVDGMTEQQIYGALEKYPNLLPHTRAMLENQLGKIQERGKETRVFQERKALAKEMNLEEGSSAYQSYMATGNPGRNQPLGAADRKEVYKAEDELPEIQGTKEALNRALELNPKTFTGATAGARGWIGTRLPMDHMDKDAAKATSEWSSLMSQAAIEKMADTLKGATTDFELRKFVEILADPSSDVDLRRRTIERMLKLAERQEKIKTDRFNQLRDGSYFKSGGGSSAKPGAPSEGQPQQRLRFNPKTGDFE
jgi:hypothetical protein